MTDLAGTFLMPDIADQTGSLSQKVYLTLREAILCMQLRPGDVLRKSVICEQAGVSRQPVSEAIARLASEGLVDVIPQSGTRVSLFAMDEIREAAFLREALEIAATGKVASGCTEEQIARLNRNIRLQELLLEDLDYEGLYEADEAFHTLILDFTGFPGVTSVASSVSLKLKRARLILLPEKGRPAEALQEHRAIFEAIRTRNVDAATQAMRHHLGQLMRRIEPLEKEHPELFGSRQS